MKIDFSLFSFIYITRFALVFVLIWFWNCLFIHNWLFCLISKIGKNFRAFYAFIY
jgi:hypothetical protein